MPLPCILHWNKNLSVGSKIKISYPRGRNQYNKSLKNQLFLGDETTLGLAVAFLPVLKNNEHKFIFYFELDEENKNVPKLLGLKNYIVFPKNKTFKKLELIKRIPNLITEDFKNTSFILAGNVKSIQNFRQILKINNISGKNIKAQGYWMDGKSGL